MSVLERVKELLLTYPDEISKNNIYMLYFILARLYADGFLPESYRQNNNVNPLPPLAVINPYHSERIRAQRGTFTIFPMYHKTAQSPSDLMIEMAMELMQDIKGVLARIHITDPEMMVHDLRLSGMCRSWLYPEHPIAAVEIERR
jgi:hypothetical protein